MCFRSFEQKSLVQKSWRPCDLVHKQTEEGVSRFPGTFLVNNPSASVSFQVPGAAPPIQVCPTVKRWQISTREGHGTLQDTLKYLVVVSLASSCCPQTCSGVVFRGLVWFRTTTMMTTLIIIIMMIMMMMMTNLMTKTLPKFCLTN